MSINYSKNFASNLPNADDVKTTITALAHAAIEISDICALGPLAGALGATTGGENADGDSQKALDVQADELITAALMKAPVAYYASEEQDDIVTLDKSKALAVASDPLDGSSNIDTNVSVGTIFSIYNAKSSAKSSFFRSGRDQLVGGFFIFGPQTTLVVTAGAGTELYVLDPSSRIFTLAIAKMEIPARSKEYAINASNHHHWGAPVRSYIEDCLLGASGPLGQKKNMRWVGSLVADANRILMRGGVFLYPGDDRKGYEAGRLRLLYECHPAAFLIEQAGGLATDGSQDILDIELTTLHQRVPFIYGSKDDVNTIKSYHNS